MGKWKYFTDWQTSIFPISMNIKVLKDSAYKIICDKKEGILELLRNSIDGYKGVNSSISEKSCEELLESIFCILSLIEEDGSAAHEY